MSFITDMNAEEKPFIRIPNVLKCYYLWKNVTGSVYYYSPHLDEQHEETKHFTEEGFVQHLTQIFSDSNVEIEMHAIFCLGYKPEEEHFIAGSKWEALFLTDLPSKHSGELETKVGLWIKHFDKSMLREF
jgi:hypothetical protein